MQFGSAEGGARVVVRERAGDGSEGWGMNFEKVEADGARS